MTNELMLGIGSGGGKSQAVEASYNDITITYNSNVTVEQEGRCYDSASIYYRLNKGQIFTSDNVIYVKDRDNLVESAFYFDKNGYVDLDEFPEHCFSDPSKCESEGFSLSFYTLIDSTLTGDAVLVR